MSWGALPWWVYAVNYEHNLASSLCAFESEWFSGTSREHPEHIIRYSKSTFSTWEPGGWNYEEDDEKAS